MTDREDNSPCAQGAASTRLCTGRTTSMDTPLLEPLAGVRVAELVDADPGAGDYGVSAR